MGRGKRRPISLSLRFSVYERDRHTCQYCGRHSPGVVLHVDHVKPVSRGGTNRIDNLLTSCADCNIGKGARDPGLAMPQRPKTVMERELEARDEDLWWAEISFYDAAPSVKGLMWELAGRGGCSGVEYRWPRDPRRREEVASLIRGLVAVGAIRVTERCGDDAIYILLEHRRGCDDDPGLRFGLCTAGSVGYAPTAAEVYG